ncbi:hypothetical protein JB92DRAFT_1667718 [Gautieria morchelliformis]|nr:hypothetical protein JB92DRAFT_1667718 [Gautieria morchelliformis]
MGYPKFLLPAWVRPGGPFVPPIYHAKEKIARFMSVIIQHPLMLTIFARFIYYHIPASLLCNTFFTIVLFSSYRGTDAILRSPECTQGSTTPICNAFASLAILTWVYLFLILPTCIFQSYVHVMIKRFIFVVSGEWALQQEELLERQRRTMGMANRKRRTTITQTIGNGGRRRAKALWFTMETTDNATDGNESFLPSMLISPMDFTSPPRTPFSISSTAGLLSPFRSPMLGKKTSKSSLPSLHSSPAGSKKDGLSDRSANMDMDFSDPDPVVKPPHSGEWMKPAASPWQESGEGEKSRSDTHTRTRQGASSITKL